MPPQQAWASRQFIDCESDGKSRAVQCKWCVDKKVAYNSTSRKTSHLKQCVAFVEHVVQLIEAENAGGYLCRELEQMPSVVLEHILDQTGARRLLQSQSQNHAQSAGLGAGAAAGGVSNLFAGAMRNSLGAGVPGDTPIRADSAGARAGALRTETPRAGSSTATTAAARSQAYNKSAVDRAFASVVQDSAMPSMSTFNANTHPAMIDALRLLDRETRVRIARELLDEAYEEVKRAVDNYIEKQQYLNSIVDDGDLPVNDRPGIPN